MRYRSLSDQVLVVVSGRLAGDGEQARNRTDNAAGGALTQEMVISRARLPGDHRCCARCCFSSSRVAAPPLAQEYQSKELADAARDWRQELIDSVPANKKQPSLVAALRRTAEIEYQAKDYTAAIGKLTQRHRQRRR